MKVNLIIKYIGGMVYDEYELLDLIESDSIKRIDQ